MSPLENSHTCWCPTMYIFLTTIRPPKTRPKNAKKPLKRDLKTKSAKIYYFYPNIRIYELNFIFLDTSQHIITWTLKTAFLSFFNRAFFAFFFRKMQIMQWNVKNCVPWKILILLDTSQGILLRIPKFPKNAFKKWKNAQKSLKMRILKNPKKWS